MDSSLYDEFGNYIGPELEDGDEDREEEEEEEQYARSELGDDEDGGARPGTGMELVAMDIDG
jgi:U5 small nuclear ribonucleoprotein component